MHVHVYYGDGEAKFWLIPDVELVKNYELSNRWQRSQPLSGRDMTNSRALGRNTLEPEVTNVSSHGVWLLVNNRELFMSYQDFPWFKDAPIAKVLKVEELTPGHFYWPELDIDLTVDIIEHPDRFPLKSK